MDKTPETRVIVLEEINPRWSLFDFHSSVSCLEVQVFLSQHTERGFSVDVSHRSLKRDVMALESSLVPSSVSES